MAKQRRGRKAYRDGIITLPSPSSSQIVESRSPAPTYLATLDLQLEDFIPQSAWDHFLWFGLLFHNSLVAPDGFFLSSKRLEDHLERWPRGMSPIEEALGRKIVVPAFRSNEGSFAAMLAKIGESGIHGPLPSANRIAERLDAACTGLTSQFWVHFPASAAEEFEHQAERVILASSPPKSLMNDPDASQLWTVSEPWRVEGFKKACALARSRSRDTRLRRGDWIDQLARLLGWQHDHPVDRASTLFELVRDQRRPQHEIRALEHVVRSIIDCYQTAHAIKMKVAPSFPYSDPRWAILCHALLPQDDDPDLLESDTIEAFVPFPKLHILQQLDAKNLLDIRQRFGDEYLTALNQWYNGANNKAAVEEALLQYGSSLYAAVRRPLPKPNTSLNIKMARWKGGKTAFRGVLWAAQAVAAAGWVHPGVGVVAFLVETGFSVMSWMDRRPEYTRVAIKRPPTPRLSQPIDIVTPPSTGA